MKFFVVQIYVFASIVIVIASDISRSHIDAKQEKRSLPQDEWSSSAIDLPAALSTGIDLGVSTHTDTLTTVREKVPIPSPYPVPQPYPVDRPVPVAVPQPYPVHHLKTVPQPYPVEVVKHVPVEVVKHIDRPYPM